MQSHIGKEVQSFICKHFSRQAKTNAKFLVRWGLSYARKKNPGVDTLFAKKTKTTVHSFFFYKNVVFPAQAEYSYFSADFRLKIFLYYP